LISKLILYIYFGGGQLAQEPQRYAKQILEKHLSGASLELLQRLAPVQLSASLKT
jgi:hypothetical protein